MSSEDVRLQFLRATCNFRSHAPRDRAISDNRLRSATLVDAESYLKFIHAGSRFGWSWCTFKDDHNEYKKQVCEIDCLDPVPSTESSDYGAFTEELQRIEQCVDVYRGFYQPPAEEEYQRLCESFW